MVLFIVILFLIGSFSSELMAQSEPAKSVQGKRIDVPLTLAVRTPHVPWGKPWVGKPIHALVVPSISEGRTLVELAERFPLTYDTVTIDSSWSENSYVGIGSNYGARTYKLLYGYLAEDLNSNVHYDVIVLPSLFGWNRLPQGVRDAILRRVRDGAGLVLIHPTTGIPASDDPKTTRPMNKTAPYYSVAPGGELWQVSPLVGVLSDRFDNEGHLRVRSDAVTTGPWRDVDQSFITNNLPVASFPGEYLKHYKYHLGTGSTALVEGSTGEPIVATKKYGKGRVVALGYLNHGLSPEIPWSFLGKQNDQWWEYFYSLLGRSIIWSAQRVPKMRLLPMKVNVHGSAEEQLQVSIRNLTQIRNASLLVDIVDKWGDHQGTFTRKIEIKRGLNSLRLNLPPNKSAGRQYVDVILSSGGKHYDWGTATFTTPQPDRIFTASTDKQFYMFGDPLHVTIHTAQQQRVALLVDLFDNRRRLIGTYTESIPPSEGSVSYVTVPVGNYSTNIGWLQVSMLASIEGRTVKLDQRRLRVDFARRDRKFGAYELILPWYGPPSYEPWKPALISQLRKVGVSVGANPRDNLKLMAEIDAPGFGVAWPFRRSYIEQKDRYLQTHDTRYLIRDPDLSSHRWLDHLRKVIIKSMQSRLPYRPLAYYLADESSLTAYNDAFDLSWSRPTLTALRRWLQGQYTSLDALNTEWDTGFKSWDDVTPLTTAQAQAKGDYAGWMDHRTFMEHVYTNAMRVAADTVMAVDPAGISSISGTQDPGPSNGINWYLLDHTVGYLQPYSMHGQDDLHRSIHAGQLLTGFTGYGSVGDDLRHQLWHRLLEGQIGASLFWQYTVLNPDLTLTEQGKELGALVDLFRNGGLALLLRNANRDNCGIAIHYSLLSLRGHWITDGHIVPHEVAQSDTTSANLRRFYRDRGAWRQALNDAGYQYDFVTTEQIERGRLSNYKVLVLPDSIALSKGEVIAIRDFVARGGLLISDGEAGLMDAHARWQAEGLLDDVLGIRHDGVRSEPKDNQPVELRTRVAGQSIALDVKPVSTTLTVNTGHATATIDNTPVLIENSFGAGHSLMLNFWLTNFGDHGSGPGSSLGFAAPSKSEGSDGLSETNGFLRLLKGELRRDGIFPVVNVQSSGGKPLKCSEVVGYRKNNMHYLAILPGLGCSDVGRVSIHLRRESYVYDLVAHRFLGHTSSITAGMNAGAPVLLALSPLRVGVPEIHMESAMNGMATVKAGGTIEFVIRQPDRPAAGNPPEPVHVEVDDPNGNMVNYYSRNLSMTDGQTRFTIATALNDIPGTWTVKTTNPYMRKSSIETFIVTR